MAASSDQSALVSLPQEVLVEILHRLDVGDILRLSESCQTLRIACSSPDLWKYLLERDFHLDHPRLLELNGEGFRQVYLEQYERRKAAERAAQMPPPPISPPPAFGQADFLPPQPSGFNPYGVPGILGGPDDGAPPDPFQPRPRWFPGRQPHPLGDPFFDPLADPFGNRPPWHPGPRMGPRIYPRHPFSDPDRPGFPRGPRPQNPFGGGGNFPGFL